MICTPRCAYYILRIHMRIIAPTRRHVAEYFELIYAHVHAVVEYAHSLVLSRPTHYT